MTNASPSGLDPRAWLLWGGAASLVPLLGRNPFPLLAVTIAVVGVRAAWTEQAGAASWRWVVRLAALFAVLGVLFNLLTYHGGDRVLLVVPERLPIIGGPLTMNALLYGLLGGWAVVLLVLIGTTVAALIDWPAALRLVPARLATAAVAGSVAFVFLPQTAAAYRDIREAQAVRGYRVAGARDLVPIIVPLLTSGLERAMTTAEALEARAFGAPAGPLRPVARAPWTAIAGALALAAGAASAFLVASGRVVAAGFALIPALTLAVFLLRAPSGPGRTRFRRREWSRADTLTACVATVAIAAVVLSLAGAEAALRYEPYPSIRLPEVNLALLGALAMLVIPALLAPARPADEAAPTW